MMNRNYLAKITPVLSCSLLVSLFAAGLAVGQAGASKKPAKAKTTKAAASRKTSRSSSKKAASKPAASSRPSVAPVTGGKGGELAQLVRAYRGNPSPARLTAVENYAASHRAGENGNLARVALGVIRYEKGDYPQAIAALEPVKAPAISDYVAYYLAASRVEAEQFETVARDLAPVYQEPFASPLAGRARLLEARTLKASNPQSAIKLLREQTGLGLVEAKYAVESFAGQHEPAFAPQQPPTFPEQQPSATAKQQPGIDSGLSPGQVRDGARTVGVSGQSRRPSGEARLLLRYERVDPLPEGAVDDRRLRTYAPVNG
jgi:hypothetical protein